MKRAVLVVIACMMFVSTGAFGGDRETIVQFSTIDALLHGVYDGQVTMQEMKQYGDFAIGTFNALDGEMLMLDRTVYQIPLSGKVRVVEAEEDVLTPFAVVTYFDNDARVPLEEGLSLKGFEEYADTLMESKNMFYALRAAGTFRTMKTRSVPKQEPPYKPLAEVVKSQAVFEFEHIEGTLVGFWCPSFVKGINVPGYHLHFLSADGKSGGHVLDFEVEQGELMIDRTSSFLLHLPQDNAFLGTDLTGDMQKELHEVER